MFGKMEMMTTMTMTGKINNFSFLASPCQSPAFQKLSVLTYMLRSSQTAQDIADTVLQVLTTSEIQQSQFYVDL
jgi:hypothetical protein